MLKTPYRIVFALMMSLASGRSIAADPESDVEFGTLIHSTRKFVVFTARNKGDLDVSCRLKVTADYVDGDNKEIGFREVALSTVVRAVGIETKEEAGKDIIVSFEAQSPQATIARLHDPSKNCSEDIEYNGNGFNYRGPMKNGKPEGYGTLTKEEYKYTGNFAAGKKEGDFSVEGPNGYNFSGSYAADERNGNGTETTTKYSTVGFWAAGTLVKGTRTYDSGIVYEGTFSDGDPSGTGKFTYKSGDIYIGSIQNRQKDGKGVYTTVNGVRSEGTWSRDKRSGYFKITQRTTGNTLWKGFYQDGQSVRGGYSNTSINIPSSASLTLCNNTTEDVSLAVGTLIYNTWRANGWYAVKQNACRTVAIYSGDNGIPKGAVYYYVTANPATRSTYWNSTGSQVSFCVDRYDPFNLPDSFCAGAYHPDFTTVSFGQLTEPPSADKNYRLNITK